MCRYTWKCFNIAIISHTTLIKIRFYLMPNFLSVYMWVPSPTRAYKAQRQRDRWRGELQAQFYATTKSLIEDKLCCVCAAVENQPTSTWKISPTRENRGKLCWGAGGGEVRLAERGFCSVGIACMFASYLFCRLSFRFLPDITFLISFFPYVALLPPKF